MNLYFADTSALAKRYLPETGSAWVKTWIQPSPSQQTLISELAVVEFISLLARRQREGSVSMLAFNQLKNDLLLHVRHEYRVILIKRRLMKRASQLVAEYPLRTLDAIQLSSAVTAAKMLGVPVIFISADQKLLQAAAAEGFFTDSPTAHP